MLLYDRDSFDYSNYAKGAFNIPEESIPLDNGWSSEQKEFIYDSAVKYALSENMKQFSGTGRTNNAIDKTIKEFGDSRDILGIPEEKSSEEPFSNESFSNYLSSLDPNLGEMSVNDFVDDYTNRLLKDKHRQFERPSLNGVNKKVFQDMLSKKLPDGIFYSTVSEAIKTLNSPQDQLSQEDEDDDDGILFNLAANVSDAIVTGGSGLIRLVDSILPDDITLGSDGISFDYYNAEELAARGGEVSTLKSLADAIDNNLLFNAEADTTPEKIAAAGGQLLGFLLGGATGAVVKGAKTATAVTTALGIGSGSSVGYNDYIQSVREQGFEIDPSTERSAIQLNSAIGLLESVVPLNALKRIMPGGELGVGKLFERLDQVTGGSVKKALNKGLKTKTSAAITRGVEGAVEEGTSELLAGILTNIVASDVLEYDKERGLLTEDVIEGGEMGAYAGGIFNAIISTLTPRQRARMNEQLEENLSEDSTAAPADPNAQFQRPADPNARFQRPIDVSGPELTPIPGVPPVNNNVIPTVGGVAVSRNNRTVVAETEEQANEALNAQINKESSGPIGPSTENAQFETEKNGDVTTTKFKDEGAEVTYTGDKSSDALNGLIDSHNDPESPVKLTNGLSIQENGDGTYTSTLDDVSFTGTDLEKSISVVTELNVGGKPFDRNIAINEISVTEDVELPFTEDGFDRESLDTFLESEEAGFSILGEGDTKDSLTIYKDGFVYKIDKGEGTNGTVTITDLDGNKFGEPRKLESKTLDGPDPVSVFVLPKPPIGVITTVNPDGDPIIDKESVEVTAEKLGGEVLFVNADSAAIQKDGESTTFTLNEGGTIDVQVNNESINFKNGFTLTDSTAAEQFNVSKVVSTLESQGHVVEVVKGSGPKQVVQLARDNETTFVSVHPDGIEVRTETTIDDVAGTETESQVFTDIADMNSVLDIETLPIDESGNVDVQVESRFTDPNNRTRSIDTTTPGNQAALGVVSRLQESGYRLDNTSDTATGLEFTMMSDEGTVSVNANNGAVNVTSNIDGPIIVEPERTAAPKQAVTPDRNIQPEGQTDILSSLKANTIPVSKSTNSVVTEEFTTDEVKGVHREDLTDSQRQTIAMRQVMDKTDELNQLQMVDGKPTFVFENGPNVILDVDPEDAEIMLSEIASETAPSGEQDSTTANQTLGWTVEDVAAYVFLLPKHIQKIIMLNTEPNNPLFHNAYGLFGPYSNGGGPGIYIDISDPTRTLGDIISTISHEVSHFGMNSWGNPRLKALYDKAFKLLRGEIKKDLQLYIDHYNVDMDNPTEFDKWLLVQEYFAELGTTFFDIDVGSATLPAGIDLDRLHKLKNEADKTLTEVKRDLTKDSDMDSKEAQAFIEDIIKLQAGSVLGRGVHITFTVDQASGETSDLLIRSTPQGILTETVNNNDVSRKLAKTRRAIQQASTFKEKAKVILNSVTTSLHDTSISQDATTIVDGERSVISKQYSNVLKELAIKGDRLKAFITGLGGGEVSIKDGYVKTLMRLGVVNTGNVMTAGKFKIRKRDTKRLELAQDLDDFQKIAKKNVYRNAQLIKQEFRGVIKMLNGLLLDHPEIRPNMQGWIDEITQTASKFSEDWDHRAYTAYTLEGQNAIKRIQLELNSDVASSAPSIDAEAKANKIEIKKVESQMADGSLSNTKGQVKLKKLNEIFSIQKRTIALREYVTEKAKQKGELVDADIIVGKMQDEINKVLNTGDSNRTPNNTKQLELINTSRGRRLNEESDVDQLLMTFLDPITDPLQVSITNLEQQNQVLNTLRFNNRLAQAMISFGVARPIGSLKNRKLYGTKSAVTEMGEFQTGSLLKYIEFDPVYAKDLKETIAINSAVDNSMLGKTVSLIKQSLTTLNLPLALSNYVGQTALLAMGGHLPYLMKYSRKASDTDPNSFDAKQRLGETTVEAWRNRAAFTLKETDSLEKTILQEMSDGNVMAASEGKLIVDVTNNDVITKTVESITKFLNDNGRITNESKSILDTKVDGFLSGMAKLYSFGDDYSKILPYLVNRELAVAKAKTMVKRNDYPDTEAGHLDYRRAILAIAAPMASKRTLRETTQWSVAPAWIRKLSKDKKRIFFGDFLMHPVQMYKIAIENAAIIYEDTKELKLATEQGHVEYATVLRNRLVSRTIGNAITYAGAGAIISGVPTLSTYAVYGIAALFQDEEDDSTPIEQRKTLNVHELAAAQDMANVLSYDGSSLLYPTPFFRDGYKIYFVNGNRSSAMNAIIPVRPDNEDPSAKDYGARMLQQFANVNNPSIAVQLWQTLSEGVNPTGQALLPMERFWAAADMIAPKIVTNSYKIISDAVDPNVPFTRTAEALIANTTSLKFKEVDIRDMISQVGYNISRESRLESNAVRRNFFNQLKSGDKLDFNDIKNNVDIELDNNSHLMGQVNFGINTAKGLGVPTSQIEKNLVVKINSVDKTGVGIERASLFVNGINAFNIATATNLKNRLKDLNKRTPDKKLNREQIDNAIEAHQMALKMVEQRVSKNPRK